MSEQINHQRRLILGAAALGAAAMEFTLTRSAFAQAALSPAPSRASSSRRLEPLSHVDAGALNIAYYEEGPADGPVAMLLHGFPYDIHSYVDVAPMLAAKGCRTIVPYLRGYGPTRFPRESNAAFGRAGCARGRPACADRCDRCEARRFRGIRLGRASRLRGGSIMAESLRGSRVRE